MKKSGCPFNWKLHTNIADCPETFQGIGGFYDYERRQVIVCKNYWESSGLRRYAFLQDKKRDSQFDIAMVRELTKAYDHCETDIDKLNSVRQMDMKMCSIIRGTVLSGICRRAQLSNTDM